VVEGAVCAKEIPARASVMESAAIVFICLSGFPFRGALFLPPLLTKTRGTINPA
jgi:hypothetical protein